LARPSELPALRVVLDTQVLLRGTSTTLGARAASLEEVLLRHEVLQKLHLNPIEARALVTLVRRRALFVTPVTPIRQSRDPADDKFLECAVAGEADYIVSADDDLLSLTEVQGIPVLDVPAFWRKLVELTLPG